MISNDGTSTQTYHFFEYADFNLGNSTSGQAVTISGGNTATDVGNGRQAQTVVSPAPSEYEANVFPNLLNPHFQFHHGLHLVGCQHFVPWEMGNGDSNGT